MISPMSSLPGESIQAAEKGGNTKSEPTDSLCWGSRAWGSETPDDSVHRVEYREGECYQERAPETCREFSNLQVSTDQHMHMR